MKKTILITAHAGWEGTEPNTWESLKKAWMLPSDFIEIDIRKRHGELWLSHNQMESTKGFLTLTDVIGYFKKQQMSVNYDLKEPVFEDVYETLKKYRCLDKAVFSGSVTQRNIEEHPEITNQIIFNIENIFTKTEISNEDYEWIIQKYKNLGLHWININYENLNPSFLKRLIEENIKISVWTVDREAHMKKMIQSGVSNITTHNVNRLVYLLEGSNGTYE